MIAKPSRSASRGRIAQRPHRSRVSRCPRCGKERGILFKTSATRDETLCWTCTTERIEAKRKEVRRKASVHLDAIQGLFPRHRVVVELGPLGHASYRVTPRGDSSDLCSVVIDARPPRTPNGRTRWCVIAFEHVHRPVWGHEVITVRTFRSLDAIRRNPVIRRFLRTHS